MPNLNPRHYRTRYVECIEIVEDLDFCIGNAIKYIWRAGLKGPADLDLEKAEWYLRRATGPDRNPPKPITFDLTSIEGTFDKHRRNALRAIWAANERYPGWRYRLTQAIVSLRCAIDAHRQLATPGDRE
jgi:hypothetical protein